mmetsp:Transcript_36794/g.78122  ORF Transcript_36794/g.78122 Transcript_36794/m.78122 type:complete len:304 (+) Transcript_36794:176-1087(+)
MFDVERTRMQPASIMAMPSNAMLIGEPFEASARPTEPLALQSYSSPWEADGFALSSASSRPGSGEGHRSNRPASGRSHLPLEVEQLVSEMDQRVTHLSQVESSRLRLIQDQVQKLGETLQSMRVQRQLQDDRTHQELRYLETNAEQDLSRTAADRHDFENRLEERIGKFFEDLRRNRPSAAAQLAEDRSVADSVSEHVGHEVHRLSGMIREQRGAREGYGDRIEQSLEAEFHKVQEAIDAEQALRLEAQKTIERMVQDVSTRIRAEIRQERDARETVQNRLLGLLEETCSRIEGSCRPGTLGF